MAVRKSQTAEKIQGGGEDRVKLPGWYHVYCTYSSDVTKKGTPIEGIATEWAVFDGQPEERKVHEMAFFDPDQRKEPDSNGYKMAVRKQTAFLVATGLITEQAMGSEVEYDTDHAVNRQAVIHLVLDDSEANKGKGYLQLSYDDVFHVDDPRVADLVKEKKVKLNVDALKLYAKFRRDPNSFDLEKLGGRKKSSGSGGNGGNGNGSHASNGNGSGTHRAPQQQQTAAAQTGVNLDDI